ncbi:MAG: YabP/YqfC family sporulation protein [bacterium]|nr:YabP/YqfC family sporulation protein [bacterium]
MLNRIKDYINDKEFRMTIFTDRIHIINYLQILSIEDERVAFLTNKGRIIIKGNNLCLNKLLDDEVLVSGFVSNIEVDFND